MDILLFCTAEEAKPVVRKTLKDVNPTWKRSLFFVPQFKQIPEATRNVETRDGIKKKLKDEEDFVSEFIGATEEECQEWVQAHQYHYPFIEPDFLLIADARSARDDTLLLKLYKREVFAYEVEGIERNLPEKGQMWYGWRIGYKEAGNAHIHLRFGTFEMSYPLYYFYHEELTGSDGVFDVNRADRIIGGEEVWSKLDFQ